MVSQMVLKRRGVRTRSRSALTALAAASVLVAGPVLAGCGDNGAGDPTHTGTRPVATDRPIDPAHARAEITKNWTAFFDPKTPVEEKVRVLENGEQMRPVIDALKGDQAAGQATAKVKQITFTSPTAANVTYDLLVAGTPALPDSKGTSVLQNDVWKVSVKTLCGLVQLSGVSAPGC